MTAQNLELDISVDDVLSDEEDASLPVSLSFAGTTILSGKNTVILSLNISTTSTDTTGFMGTLFFTPIEGFTDTTKIHLTEAKFHERVDTDRSAIRDVPPRNILRHVTVYPVTLLGDFNKDGVVDLKDFTLFRDKFRSKEGDAIWDPRFDLHPDGSIDSLDFALFIAQFGKTIGG